MTSPIHSANTLNSTLVTPYSTPSSSKQTLKNADSRAQSIARPNFSEERKLPVKMTHIPLTPLDSEASQIIQKMDEKFKGKFSLFLSHQLLPTVGLIFNHEKLIDCFDCFARILVRRIMIRNGQSSERSAAWHMRWALFFGHLTVKQYNFFRSHAEKESVLKFGRKFMQDFQSYVCQNQNTISQVARIKNQHIHEIIELLEYLLELLDDPIKHPFLLKPLKSCMALDSKVMNEIKQNAHKKLSEAFDLYREGFSAEFTGLLDVPANLQKEENQKEKSLELIQEFREGLKNLTPLLNIHLQKFYYGYAQQFMWIRTASLQIIQKNPFLIYHLQYIRNTEIFFQNTLYLKILIEKYQTTTFKKEPLELFKDTVGDFKNLVAHFLDPENFKQFEPKQEEEQDLKIEVFSREIFDLMYKSTSRLLIELDQEWKKSNTLDRLTKNLESLSIDFDFELALVCIKIFEEELFVNSDEIFLSYVQNYLLLYSKLTPWLKEAPESLLLIKIQKNLEQMSFWVSSIIECIRTLKKVYYAMFHLEEIASKGDENIIRKSTFKSSIKKKRNERKNTPALNPSPHSKPLDQENAEMSLDEWKAESCTNENKNPLFLHEDKNATGVKHHEFSPPRRSKKIKASGRVPQGLKTDKLVSKETKESLSSTQMPEFSKDLLKWKKMVKLAQKYADMTLKPGGKHAHLVAADPLPGDIELPLPISSRDLAKGTAHKIYDQIKSRFQRLLKNEDL